jgi:hypothetical protein
MQNRTPTKNAGQASKGGRPRKSYDYLIGTAHNFLVIDRIFRGDKNEPYAATTCIRCGTRTECRLRDILSGHTKSCKCLRPEQYLTNIKTLADRLPDQKLAQMWSMHFAGSGRWAIATAHKVAVIVVDFALRRYQHSLDRVISSGYASWIVKETINAVPAQVTEYLQKSECRVLNIFRRARAAEAEVDARCRAWEWMMRQWMRDNMHLIPIDSDAVVEFVD